MSTASAPQMNNSTEKYPTPAEPAPIYAEKIATSRPNLNPPTGDNDQRESGFWRSVLHHFIRERPPELSYWHRIPFQLVTFTILFTAAEWAMYWYDGEVRHGFWHKLPWYVAASLCSGFLWMEYCRWWASRREPVALA